MVTFHYRRIDAPLVQELNEGLLCGESLVLLGPRYGGKREVMKRLCARQEEAGAGPVVRLGFLTEPALASTEQVRWVIDETVREVGAGSSDSDGGDSLFASLDRLRDSSRRPVVLCASNVDGMAYHLARRFLEGIRVRVEAGHLVALLSGEGNFRELVHGPNSEFNCANQYVFQGFARDDFHDSLGRYARRLPVEFDSPAETLDHLWRLTGGNLHVSRAILCALMDARARRDQVALGPVKLEELRSALSVLDVLGVNRDDVFGRAVRLVSREPNCWGELEELISAGVVELNQWEATPSSLELAGVAVRDVGGGHTRLLFTSQLMEAFVRLHYAGQRVGDLYANAGMWEKAFERYSRLDPELSLRPSGVDDRAEVEAALDALCASLYAEATHGIEAVKSLFTQGCRHLLGFGQVMFWRHDLWAGYWRDESPDEPGADAAFREKLLRSLPEVKFMPTGTLPLPLPFHHYSLAVVLPGRRPDERVVVAVSDPGQGVISRERGKLCRKLLAHFSTAYAHANHVDMLTTRLEERGQHVRIMNSIFSALGFAVKNVEHVLRLAAEGLRHLGYRRVLFCLVDPEARHIRGVLDHSDDPSADLASLIDVPLGEPTADIQSYVIDTKQRLIVSDVREYPLADRSLWTDRGGGPLAVVPILNPAGAALGTILVERDDRAVPTDEEVEDLFIFGRQLAIAIEQGGRVNLLESTLDRIPEPIVIVDSAKRLRYTNLPAAELFGGQAGWRDLNHGAEEDEPGAEAVARLVGESMSIGQRLAKHVTGVGRREDYSARVLADVIRNWRGETVGGLLRIQDFNYLDRVIRASQLVAGSKDTESAMQSMLDAAKLLGHRWGRLYLLKGDPPQFVSARSFGFADTETERSFNEGKIVLPLPGEGESAAWLCIERNSPVVFCWLEGVADRAEYVTPHGLRAINWVSPQQPLGVLKRPGDFWIDFPLVTPQAVLGKLSLQCDQNLRPEDFELLKILSETAASLFESSLSRERDFGEREQVIRVSVAQRVMATLAHNLGTRLAALPVILTRYRMLEPRFEALKPLNDQFSHLTREAFSTITRAKELLTPVVPRVSPVDLVAVIKRTLALALPEGSWSVECGAQPAEVELDEHLFGTALLELVQNSQDAAPSAVDVRVSVEVKAIQEGPNGMPWVSVVYGDDGPGIPDDITERIFEDFFSHRPGGKTSTGLGLGFVRRAIEAHGGAIYYNSLIRPRGAFVIILPCTPPTRGEGE